MPQRKENIGKKEPRTIYRSRLLNTIQAIIISAFLLVYPLTACAGETNPVPQGGLPCGVFPLNNDVRFIQTSSWDYGALESILDPENGKPIAVFSKNYVRTEIFSFRKIGENKAEMYSTSEVTLKRKGFDLVNGGELQFQDSTWAEPIKLIGWFTLEENKVYYQYNDELYGTDNFLYFDFDLKLNDTFRAGSFSEYQYNAIFSVASIDSVLITNEYRKRYKCVSLSEGFYDFYVVEGIGSLGHLFEPLDPPGPSTIVSSKKLEAVYYKDRLIWSSELYWQGGI